MCVCHGSGLTIASGSYQPILRAAGAANARDCLVYDEIDRSCYDWQNRGTPGELAITVTWYVTGLLGGNVVPPPPWALTPEQDPKISRSGTATSWQTVSRVCLYSYAAGEVRPKSQVSAGINRVAKNIPLNTRRKAALLPPLEMLITTLIADAPGVMGVDGLNLHCAPDGRPLAHARVTGALNDAPIG